MSKDAEKTNGLVVSIGPGKTVVMPDIYSEGAAAEDDNLEIVDQLADDEQESSGFNPYDTAVLYKKP